MNSVEVPSAKIAVERCRRCHVCGAIGRETSHKFRDRLYSVPGDWSLRVCPAPDCGLFWLDPMPCPADITHLYPHGYFTHAPLPHHIRSPDAPAGGRSTTWLARIRYGWRFGLTRRAGVLTPTGVWERIGGRTARICGLLPGIGPASRHPEAWLPCPAPSAKLLDVGCGSGEFLARMRRLGWDVYGIEPDPTAAETARATLDVPVVQGTLDTVRENATTFDAVSLLHVIEHVPDPRETLRAAWELLRPGGRLLVVTPNARSLGAHVFGGDWVAWDPPRHLHVFTSVALQRLLASAGYSLERFRSTGRNARWTWDASTEIRRTGRCLCVNEPHGTVASHWGGRLARLAENLLPGRYPLGEELVAVGIKSPDDPPSSRRHNSPR